MRRMDDGRKTETRREEVLSPANCVSLQPLIAKLGHSVEEIRVRALKNILFKLDHKLICAADLVHERQLLAKLLEWFNFPNCCLKREVLGILETLSKPVSGAENLLSIGAVEFLSHLRQDVDPELYQRIDNVIYQLLSLPQDDAQDHEHWCLYKMHKQEDMETVKSSEQQGSLYFTSGPTGSVHREGRGELRLVSVPKASVNDDNCSLSVWSHVNHTGGCFNEQSVQTTCQETLRLLHTQSTFTTANSQETVNKCRKASLSFFQWLSLSASDKHILSVTASRLQSHSSSLVSKSCEFLMDVLFKDFPAEIFLHRPTVLQALLELVEDKVPVSKGSSLTLGAMKCLCDFCQHLHIRLAAISDPAVFCPDQDCWKYQHQAVTVDTMNQATEHLQVSNARENGDGGVDSEDQSSSLSENKPSTGSDEDEDEMLTEALQFNQLSVEEFCMIVLSRVIPMCQGALSTNLTAIETAVNLLHEVLSLMKKVLPGNLWQNGTQLHSLMGTSLKNVMKSLAESVMHHIKQYTAPDTSRENSSKHRLQLPTYRMAAVSVASFFVQFLEALVPVDVAFQVVPPDVTTVLWFLVVDELLALTHVHLRPILTKYLAVLDPNAHSLGLFAQEICKSMDNTCKFVKASRMKEKHSLKHLLDIAEKSVTSVTFHKHMEFISDALKLCSRICDPVNQANSQSVPVSHKITLQLLAHPDPDVRLQAYKVCLTLLKDAFSVSHVTEPLSKVCQRALFLLDRAVLHQICCFGIYDEVKTVNTAALELITTLLLGRLSMSGELWKKLLDGLIASLPQLQGCIQLDPSLSQCILELAASSGVTGAHVAADGDIVTLPALERFRGALRLMFINDPQVRTKAFEYVVWNLTNEASGEKRRLCVGGSWREDAADMFIVDQVTCAVYAHVPGSHSSVDHQEVLQLWSILSSSSLDVALRKSSAQHLAIILQDPQWHAPLLEGHSDEVCVSILSEILDKDADGHSLTTPSPRVELVPPCLTILRLLVEYSAPCRHKLAQSSSTYSLVIRCAFLCHPNGQATYETACLMALLLFDEAAVAVPDPTNRIPFSLPKSLLKRFQFPFSPPVHDPVSVHQLPGINDSLTSEPAVSMLRLAWNLGWHESIENLSRVNGVEDTGQTLRDLGYWPALQWRSVDADLLRCSHVATALTAQLRCMESAGSHHDVMRSLNTISAHLIADKGVMRAAARQRLAVDVLFSLKWENAFERYLQVIPNNGDDDTLLIEVLKVLDTVLSSPRAPPEPVAAWVARTVLQRDGPQMTLLRNVQNSAAGSQTVSESKRALRKHLLSFLVTLVKCVSQYTKGWRLGVERVFVGDLAYALALNLDLADNPQFYDLPVLETSLICLAHITAQPQWSLHCRVTQGMGLCIQLLTSLVQVVLAFHAGRLGAHLSFMGKGVTYYASLCLVHVMHELAVIDPSQAWVAHWVQEKSSPDAPLTWLVPLLTDRWPEIRWMGLAICTSLANSAHGREELELAGQRFAGGLWNVVFSVVLDDMECAIVRQQASLLLCSLTNGLVPTQNSTDVKSQDQNISMNIQVLFSLVERLQFFSRLSTMLSNGSLPLTVRQGTSKACQSSASVSVSSGTNTDIPYKPLGSGSGSGSVSSEVQNTTVDSTNGQASPGGLSGLSHTTSTVLSTVSSSEAETQPSITPTSSMPLINERGLPSGMSNTSSSDVSSWEGSTPHSSSPVATSSVTPGLIGAVAQVLNNLVLLAPERIIPALSKTHVIRNITLHLDCSDVNRYVDTQNSRSSSQHRTASVVISQILVMYCNIMTLHRSILHLDTTFCFNLLQDSETVDKIVSLFAIDTPGRDKTIERCVLMMWESISRLLVTLLQKQGHLSVPSVAEEILYSHWSHFTRVFKSVAKADKSSTVPSLKNSLLKLLGLLVSFEGKRHSAKRAWSKEECSKDRPIRKSMVLVLDDRKGEVLQPEVGSLKGVNRKEDCNTLGCLSSGSELCSVLLGAYDSAQPLGSSAVEEERNLVNAVLSSLLAVSQSAKNTALQAGFIETAVERIKHLHVQLNVHSLQLGKGPSWRKKDDPLIIELVKALQLLRNFIFHNSQIKAACLECGIVVVLHKLWSWCTVEVSLLVEVLRLLCTLTAHFTKASALLAGSSGVPGTLSRAAQSGSTLLHSLIKMANKTNSKLQINSSPDLETHLQTHKNMFSLLSNLVWSVECRGVMWKTNFLQSFSSIKPLTSCSHPKQRSITRTVLLSWLSLLVNVTFFNDGQQGVVKSAGSVQVLVELCTVQHRQLRDRALLVLRNLCFHSASKPVLFGNGKLLTLLVDSIADNSNYIRALSLSALCALLYNCQKAKVSLKKTGIVKKAEEAKFQTANEQSTDNKYNKMCCESLEILQKILSEQR